MELHRVTGPSDQLLVARIAACDRDAFGQFYDRHHERIFALVLRWVRQPREAEDVLQEIFWQVWMKADQFDARRASPLAWLILIARSRAFDHLRGIKRRADAGTARSIERAEPAVATDYASDLHRDEVNSAAQRALAALPEEQRSAIWMAFYGGLTHQEIAEQQNIALGTIKTRIRLGMQKMRESLSGAQGELVSY